MKIDLKKFWTEKVLPHIKEGADHLAKPALEAYAIKLIEAKSDLLVDKVAELVKTSIPGPFDDNYINANIDKVKADVKASLLAEAGKISDKV